MEINNEFLEKIITIAVAAGEEILKYYQEGRPLNVVKKEDNSPVTLADLTAHSIIQQHLAKITPNIPLLSEEDPNFTFDQRAAWETYWLVDPLDGTREFIAHTGQFTVNIALIHRSIPILGVIYVPLKNRVYAGAATVPSFKQEGSIRERLRVRNWQPGEELILVTTRRELHEKLQRYLQQLGPLKITYRSSSLKFCLISEGRADIYLRKEPIQEWDTAAGQCIVENSGGVVLDSNWEALRYNTKPHLLNPPFIALGCSTQLSKILKTMPMFEEI